MAGEGDDVAEGARRTVTTHEQPLSDPTNYLLIPGAINLRPRCAAAARPRGGCDNFFP